MNGSPRHVHTVRTYDRFSTSVSGTSRTYRPSRTWVNPSAGVGRYRRTVAPSGLASYSTPCQVATYPSRITPPRPAPTWDRRRPDGPPAGRSEEHTSELQSRENLVCRLLLEKKKNIYMIPLHVLE